MLPVRDIALFRACSDVSSRQEKREEEGIVYSTLRVEHSCGA